MVKSKGDHPVNSNVESTDLPFAPSSSAGFGMLLPFHSTLPDGKHVIVNDVTDHRVTEIFNMIQQAALNGDGYGVDEFPTEKDLLKEVQHENGKIFQVRATDSGTTIAGFILLDSKFYRGQGTVADSYIIVKQDERRKGIGEFCMQTALEFARRLGYIGIYSDTLSDNVAMRKLVEHMGFQKVGFLPVGAKMPDGSMKPSVIYYLDLGPASQQLQQMEERTDPSLPSLTVFSNCSDSSPS